MCVLWLLLSDSVWPASAAAGKSALVAGPMVRRLLNGCIVLVRRRRWVEVVAVVAIVDAVPGADVNSCRRVEMRVEGRILEVDGRSAGLVGVGSRQVEVDMWVVGWVVIWVV